MFDWCCTFGRFGSCPDAVFRTVDLLSLHHNVLETFVVCDEAVLQQFTERHRTTVYKENKKNNTKMPGV